MMGIRGKKLKLLTCFLAGLFLVKVTAFGKTDSLTISQIIQEGQEASVSISILDEEGNPVNDRQDINAFQVNIGEETRLKPVVIENDQNSNEGFAWLFCLDCSVNVSDKELEQAKSVIINLIKKMGENDTGGLITFGGEVDYAYKLGGDIGELEATVKDVDQTSGKPLLFEGLKLALKMAGEEASSYPGRIAVLVITNGNDESNPMVSEGEVQKESIHARVPVYVAGLDEGNTKTVDQIARYAGGMIFTEKDGSLSDCIEKIRSILMSRYRLKVKLPEGSDMQGNQSWRISWMNTDEKMMTSPSYVFNILSYSKEAGKETKVEKVSEANKFEDAFILTEKTDGTEICEPAETEKTTLKEGYTAINTESAVKGTETLKDNQDKQNREKETPSSQEHGLDEGTGKGMMTVFIVAAIVGALLLLLLALLLFRRKKVSTVEKKTGDALSEDRIKVSQQKKRIAGSEQQGEVLKTGQNPEQAAAPASNSIQLRMMITFGGRKEEKMIVLADQIVLGRGKTCDIDVTLGIVGDEANRTSRRHTILILRGDKVYVRDAGAVNRTVLNGKTVMTDTLIKMGDVLKLGNAIVQILSYQAL